MIETRRPRAGWPVLALLALAGLLRPEAWLFSFAYLAYLVLSILADGRDESSPAAVSAHRRKLRCRGDLTPRGARPGGAGPLGALRLDHRRRARPTRSPARRTRSKPSNARPARSTSSSTARARLGEVLQWPGMVGAAGGIVLGLAFLRRRSGDRHRRRCARARRLRGPRRLRPRDHPPLHDARRRGAGDLRGARPARLAPARARPPLAPAPGRHSPRSSR